jgi:uracil-DNA glycosylase family 4
MLQELGLLPVWRLRARYRSAAAPAAHAANESLAPAAFTATVERSAVAPASGIADRIARIAALDWGSFAADVSACTACPLARTRNLTVPGVGDKRADWLFIGEAPGAEEDARGEPFVGQAGRLLDSMLAALGLNRVKAVYIANVLKCRPPNNRAPTPDEVESCLPYLDRQIAMIQPKLIVALGKSAATTLLNGDATIASLRGRIHRYKSTPLVVTYHPAYLLRTLPDKAKAWEDLCFARTTLRGILDANALQTAAQGPI